MKKTSGSDERSSGSLTKLMKQASSQFGDEMATQLLERQKTRRLSLGREKLGALLAIAYEAGLKKGYKTGVGYVEEEDDEPDEVHPVDAKLVDVLQRRMQTPADTVSMAEGDQFVRQELQRRRGRKKA